MDKIKEAIRLLQKGLSDLQECAKMRDAKGVTDEILDNQIEAVETVIDELSVYF